MSEADLIEEAELGATKAESPGRKQSRIGRVIVAISAASYGGVEIMAEAAIAAYPEPVIPKKDRPPMSDRDACSLFALRGEFMELVAALDCLGEEFPRAAALARALREQGVVP